MDTNRLMELINRWTSILRSKAGLYEHTSRENGQIVSQPDLDTIANEIYAFFVGLNNK